MAEARTTIQADPVLVPSMLEKQDTQYLIHNGGKLYKLPLAEQEQEDHREAVHLVGQMVKVLQDTREELEVQQDQDHIQVAAVAAVAPVSLQLTEQPLRLLEVEEAPEALVTTLVQRQASILIQPQQTHQAH